MKYIIPFTLFQCITYVVAAQPNKISLDGDASMHAFDKRSVKAAVTIQFKPGFRAVAGCSLLASVKEKNTGGDPARGLLLEKNNIDLSSHLEVYPNAVTWGIYIQGNFNNQPMYIFDSAGNLKYSFLIDGKNPSVDLSAMSRGIYYLSVNKKMVRIAKE